jgi:hypothetical protein
MVSKAAGYKISAGPPACFETFPFPQPTDAQREAIAEAARELERLRAGWFNPPAWTREEVLAFRGSFEGPCGRYVDAKTVKPAALTPDPSPAGGRGERKCSAGPST